MTCQEIRQPAKDGVCEVDIDLRRVMTSSPRKFVLENAVEAGQRDFPQPPRGS